MSRLLTLVASAAAALTFAGSALADFSQPAPVFDAQPALVTPDQEGDGRLVGWTTTF